MRLFVFEPTSNDQCPAGDHHTGAGAVLRSCERGDHSLVRGTSECPRVAKGEGTGEYCGSVDLVGLVGLVWPGWLSGGNSKFHGWNSLPEGWWTSNPMVAYGPFGEDTGPPDFQSSFPYFVRKGRGPDEP